MTEFQKRVVEIIERHNHNGSISQTRIFRLMGVPNVAVYNSLSALRRQKIVDCFIDGNDMFAGRYWFLTRKGASVETRT